MEKIRISSQNPFMQNVAVLYQSAFPVNERRQMDEFYRLLDEDQKFNVDVFVDGDGSFVGFLSSWEFDDFRYGEHFAIVDSKRGGGIGARVLQEFVKASDKPLIIEVEPPLDEMAARRIGFYQRNGLRLWDDIDYVQPPYGPGRDAIELKLMTFGDILLEQGDSRIAEIHRYVYGAE